MRVWAWRLYLGAGALATGVYYLLPPGPRAVLNVVVGASAVAAIAVGIAWHRDRYRLPATDAFVETAARICGEVEAGFEAAA